jgi:hypothetical protein
VGHIPANGARDAALPEARRLVAPGRRRLPWPTGPGPLFPDVLRSFRERVVRLMGAYMTTAASNRL